MTAGQIIALIVVAALTVATVAAIVDECRYGRAWRNGPGAEETRRYTEPARWEDDATYKETDSPFDPIVVRGRVTGWPTDEPAQSLALALLQPDSEQLPAEEAQR